MIRKIIYWILFGLAAAGFVAAVVLGIIGLAKVSDTLVHWAVVICMISAGISTFNVLYLKPDNKKSGKSNTDEQ